MNKEILLVVDAVSNEKGVEKRLFSRPSRQPPGIGDSKKNGGDRSPRGDRSQDGRLRDVPALAGGR